MDTDSDDDWLDEEDDEEFIQIAMLIAFPRRRNRIRSRIDHFTFWRDDEFFFRFRLKKETVQFIISLVKDQISSVTMRNQAVAAEQKVLLTLRYYATGSFITVCRDFIGIHKSTAERIIKEVSQALAALAPQFIYLPRSENEIQKVRLDFYEIAKFPRCIGAIDCTHIKIRSPDGENAEIYRNRKGYYSLNVQTISDSRLKIQSIVARWPGSVHGTTVLRNSRVRRRFESGEFGTNVLIGDSGYGIRKYLITPLLNPETFAEKLFNESIIRTRNPVERSHEVWKRRFPALSVGMNIILPTVQSVIIATAVLHNIACDRGEDVPKTTKELEELINLNMRQTRSIVIQKGYRLDHRRTFIRFFASMAEVLNLN